MQTNGFDFDDLFCDHKRAYTLFGQYSMTKLANVLNSMEQSRRWPPQQQQQQQQNVLVFAVHPGIVRTNVTSNMNWYWRYPDAMFAWFVASMQKTPAEGAYNSVYCAAAPMEELPPSGSYMMNGQAHSIHKSADSIDDAKRLWEVSERLVGLQ
jgi:NAD(P)-dependent dehydrogenase (short-subunit alcohol dehydrogenase family)